MSIRENGQKRRNRREQGLKRACSCRFCSFWPFGRMDAVLATNVLRSGGFPLVLARMARTARTVGFCRLGWPEVERRPAGAREAKGAKWRRRPDRSKGLLNKQAFVQIWPAETLCAVLATSDYRRFWPTGQES